MINPGRALVCLAGVLLAACSAGASSPSARPTSPPTVASAADTARYSGIGAGETVHFTGTEPFWGGEVSGQALTYTTPENPSGERVAVERFAGRNGISFSGQLGALPFMLAVTPGQCSDGMSDRSYPFTATLQAKGRLREGCAWTDKQAFTGSARP
jgi:uncharacterized membrane protein